MLGKKTKTKQTKQKQNRNELIDICMVIDGSQISRGDHFIRHINIESLLYT